MKKISTWSPLSAIVFLFGAALSFSTSAKTSGTSAFSHNICFTENKGQVTDQYFAPRSDIGFSIKTGHGLNIFIGSGAIHYQFSAAAAPATDRMLGTQKIATSTPQNMYRMDVELVGANKNAQVITEEEQQYQEHFCNNLVVNATAHTYSKITYKDIYPHIDWVLHISNGHLKHEFVIGKGGRVSDIQLKYGGATDLSVQADGALAAVTPQGTIKEQAPVSYQQDGTSVSSSYHLQNNIVSYAVAPYNGTLVIDPSLEWATYYGSDKDDEAGKITTDAAGNVYVCGYTKSLAGIATTGAYQVTFAGYLDAFLAKYNSAGILQWSTYYGGSSDDQASGVVTDPAGDIYITGRTGSTAGIATAGTYQVSLADSGSYPDGSPYGDGYIAKFNSAGALVWGTYFGGASPEMTSSISTDGHGHINITGLTYSRHGIATPGAYKDTCTTYPDGTFAGEAFVASFTDNGSLAWATYYGGEGVDIGIGTATDTAGNVYISGLTNSTYGIATPGAHQITLGDGGASLDGFVAKFSITGALLWATYYGGESSDVVLSVAVDKSSNCYITGYSYSTAGIATAGSYQSTYSGGSDCFLTKFNSSGVRQWATYYGGSGLDNGAGVITDTLGNIYLAGGTGSNTNIVTPDAYQTALADGPIATGSFAGDAFLAQFDSAGFLQWGTYLGGANGDAASGVTTDNAGHVYICGATNSATHIASPWAYQPGYGDSTDAFIARFNFCVTPTVDTISGPSLVCIGSTVTLSDLTTGGSWSAINTLATVDAGSGAVTGMTSGMDTILYAVANTCGTTRMPHVIAIGTFAGHISGDTALCAGSTTYLSADVSGGSWSSSASTIATVATTGIVTGISGGNTTISYTVTNACGTGSTLTHLTVNPLPFAGTITGLDTVCVGQTIFLSDTASSGVWGATTFNTLVTSSGAVIGMTIGADTVLYIVSNGCGSDTARKAITVIVCPDDVNEPGAATASTIIYPNPATDGITISSSNNIGNVIISDITGHIFINTGSNQRSAYINVSELPNGIYLVKVGDKVYKLLKQ